MTLTMQTDRTSLNTLRKVKSVSWFIHEHQAIFRRYRVAFSYKMKMFKRNNFLLTHSVPRKSLKTNMFSRQTSVIVEVNSTEILWGYSICYKTRMSSPYASFQAKIQMPIFEQYILSCEYNFAVYISHKWWHFGASALCDMYQTKREEKK